MKSSKNQTGYFLKEGFTSIFAHGLMSFASICIIIAFLMIMGSFILLAVNINSIVGDLENDNIILAYIDEYLSEIEARALERELARTTNVSRVNFITREQAMHSFIGRHDDTDRFADVDPTWFRHRYEIFVEDVALIEYTLQEMRGIYGVERVNANLTIASALVTFRSIVTGVSLVIIAVLLAISLFIMSNTIKLAIYERREEISIMRMVGATNSFIRWPFTIEGFILGSMGALSAFIMIWSVYGFLAGRVYEFENFFINLVPFSNVYVGLFLLFGAIGFGVGVGGSALALNKYLKV
ncbi:MAG: permease-like cell division protein FtsX [Oscillospiraceae bacterium]|nr:permease-like cell division protein FtsX [Oscillospiraceae bacterium]